MRAQGLYAFFIQMLLKPTADEVQGFGREWFQTCIPEHPTRADGTNVFMIVDPANSKKRVADYTAMIVVGLARGGKFVVLDLLRDRLDLRERTNAVFELYLKWRPQAVIYDEYGAQADRQHIMEQQSRRNVWFRIVEVGGSTAKEDRIRRLVPLFEAARIIFPPSIQ